MTFLRKISEKSATIGILGLGYVGIPLGLSVAGKGFKVIGFDVVQKRVDQLNSGKSPIKHFSDQSIAQMCASGFVATTDFSRAVDCDALIICVPTPLNDYREPDLSFVVATLESIAPYLRENQLLSLESTTWPGTTKEVLLPYVEKAGLKVGDNFFLV